MNNNLLQNTFRRTKMGVVALALTTLLLPACTTAEEEVSSPTAEEENVTTEELSENTNDYIGQTVSVRGEVNELVGDTAFLMDEDQIFGGEEILVFNASEERLVLPEGEETKVQVTGEVQELVAADLEEEYDLEPDSLAEYDKRPVIIAESVALSPDPGDVTEKPDRYYGQRIAVQGEVEEILDTGTFTLDEEELFGGEDLLVLAEGFTPELDDDESVTVTGTLRPYVKAEFEEEYNLTWDLDLQKQIEGEYENKPVFVADGVYPSAE
ncbi:MAG: hypothetical protein SAJ12_16400 [Jaaginema sp. PMC 1079.18]|nr:hypothetical protein [Jaaginema sp. PMC 1080.18]MEC4852566.1 hypothetical protein [Jaaginema sp. PMC 1079.18]MEC4866347.1 hypothetical protein [Jaaginema sp. PMC 1078.18]